MDSEDFIANLQEFNSKYVEAMKLLVEKKFDTIANPLVDMSSIQKIYIDAVTDFTNNPAKFFKHSMEYASKVSNLMFHFMDKVNGNNGFELYEAPTRDKRFKNKAWQESIYFNFVKQFYLMSSDFYRSMVTQLDVPNSQKRLLEFYTEQLLNAACPANYANLNPEVINELVNSNGKNLIQGITNFLEDIKRSDILFSISTVSKDMFSLGVNLASTSGKIIFQNDLMQLICYEPISQIYKIPIFIIPPWINKYYILDLSHDNSFVKFLVDQGFQVYLVSWVNPSSDYANKNLEDYLKEGVVEPIEHLQKEFGYDKFNLLGYCLGGTLAACAISYYETLKKNPFSSSTFLATMLDFSEPGELGLFINDRTIGAIREELHKNGVFNGKYMSYAFSLLRVNELIWSFVINNYLLGKKPLAFDLLYWNADTTNMPAEMHEFYLDNMYIKNALITPCGIKLLGQDIDLTKINIPTFFLSAVEDHIAPWESTYSGYKLISQNSKNSRFCLTASGHIAGVINSPFRKKYSYWINDKLINSSDEWLKGATEHEGSWWNHWVTWLTERSGKKIDAIDYKAVKFIEMAPGSFVKQRN